MPINDPLRTTQKPHPQSLIRPDHLRTLAVTTTLLYLFLVLLSHPSQSLSTSTDYPLLNFNLYHHYNEVRSPFRSDCSRL
jgi:hypothetical protein